MFINHSSREVTAKIVYYGPGLSGKTTNLQYIFSVTNPRSRGELISIETEIERTLFFDLLPINVGPINGYQTKFQLYTVPGQIFYDSTRKLVLKGADGIVFVADSQELMKQADIESLINLQTNLADHKLDINEIPLVFQYNKRDLANIIPLDELNAALNPASHIFYPAVAIEGKGILETLRGISTLILKKIREMLEHPTGKEHKLPTTNVEFNIDKKHKIIEKENLPLRKIHTENLEAAAQRMDPSNEYHARLDMKPLEAQRHKDHEEELKVETVSEIDQLRDIDNIFSNNDNDEITPIKDLEEIKLDDDFEDNFEPQIEPPIETTPEIEPKPKLESEIAFSIDNIPVTMPEEEDLFPGDEFEFEPEPVPLAGEIGLGEETNEIFPFKDLDEPQELEELQELEEPQELDEPSENKPVTPPETDRLKEIEELKKSLSLEKEKTVKKNKKTTGNVNGLDIFERLKDKTRVTVIKEIPIKDSRFFIEIKDKESNLLDSIQIEIAPDTKKVTLILDVKK